MSEHVSVVTPCFNAEEYISRMIESLLGQTHQNIEIIVVDDGSTDGSTDVVRSYDDERIQLKQQSNQGACAARNTGLALASGEYVFFLDADDFVLPHALETLLDHISDADAVYADTLMVNEAAVPQRRVSQVPPHEDMITSLMACSPFCGTVLIRQEAIRTGWDTRFDAVDEFYFFVRLAIEGADFRYIGEPVSCYRQHDSPTRKTSTITSYTEPKLRAFLNFYDLLERHDRITEWRRAFLTMAFIDILGNYFRKPSFDRDLARGAETRLGCQLTSGLRAVHCLGYRTTLRRILRYLYHRTISNT